MTPQKRAGREGKRREPKQRRSREIVSAIAEACLRILNKEGPSALNTNRIAEVAGVNIGSLYRYFPNKEAVVAEVYELQLTALAAEYEEAWDRAERVPGSLRDLIRTHVAANAEMHIRLLSLHETFYRAYQGEFDLGERISERHDRSYLAETEAWLFSQLEHHADEVPLPDDLGLAAFIVTRSVAGALRSAARDEPSRLTEPGFLRGLCDMACGYLTGGRI